MADELDPLAVAENIIANGGVPLIPGVLTGNTIYVCPDAVFPAVVPQITIPGVGQLRAIKSKIDSAPSPYEMAAGLLQQVQPMMAPIISVLRIIAVVTAIISAIKAIKKPWKLRSRMKSVARAVGRLAQFIPGISHVKMVRDVIRLISQIIRGTGNVITRWLIEIEQLVQALQVHNVLRDPELALAIDCSEQRLVESQQGMIATLSDIGQILDVVGQILDIIKAFAPGGAAKHVVEIIKKMATLPLQIQLTSQNISGAKDPIKLQQEVNTLQSIANTLDGIADHLDSVVAMITAAVGQ